MFNIASIFGCFFLPVQGNNDCVRLRAGGVDDGNRFPRSGTGRHHIVNDQDASLECGANQRAPLAVILGFLAVVGKRNVDAEPGQFYRQCGCQRDAFVGGAKNHVEPDAAFEQALGIELGQSSQFGSIVKLAGVEEVGADTAGLGLEFTEPQHATIHNKLQKILGQRVLRRG